MKRNLFIVLFGIFVHSTTFAQNNNIRGLWQRMPDSLFVYLPMSARENQLSINEMNVGSVVNYNLEGSGVINHISDNYLSIKMNDCLDVQLKLLTSPTSGVQGVTASSSDSVICMVRTYKSPDGESEVTFYSTDWQPIHSNFGLPLDTDFDQLLKSFIARPAAMSQERFDELLQHIDLVMLLAWWDNDYLMFTVSVPMLTKEETEEFKPLILQKKFKWTGDTFKEC